MLRFSLQQTADWQMSLKIGILRLICQSAEDIHPVILGHDLQSTQSTEEIQIPKRRSFTRCVSGMKAKKNQQQTFLLEVNRLIFACVAKI
jgi:hypothetical protein